jgi:hypothetical protein
VERAIETVLAAGKPRTPDLGGKATTSDLGRAVEAALRVKTIALSGPNADNRLLQTAPRLLQEIKQTKLSV